MSAERRADAIAETIETLGWCVTIPHTIDQVIGIYAERTTTTTRPMRSGMTNDEIIASISGGGSSGGKGGHSDPTARAALWGEPDAVDDDETVANIRAAVTLCHETAVEIGELCGAAWPAPDLRIGLTSTVANTISRVHRWAPLVEPTADQLHGEQLAHLDTLVRTALAETATWLHDKAFGIWDLHHGDTLPVAVQRTIVACRVHARFIRSPPNATADGLCPECAEFRHRYRCEPTEAIVRRWDYGQNATPSQIAEALAAKGRPRRANA